MEKLNTGAIIRLLGCLGNLKKKTLLSSSSN